MRRFLAGAVLFLVFVFASAHASVPKSRNLEFHYEIIIDEIPADASELKIWLPYLPQTPYQEIREADFSFKDKAQITSDKTYNNKILFYTLKSPQVPLKVDVRYKIRRYEYSSLGGSDGKPLTEDFMKYLEPNRLVTVNPRVRDMARQVTGGKRTTLEKARAIYDYVLANVSYDKTIPGWGNGDTERVCLVKAGNCTDFHSLFISLARASGIPAKFVIGTPLPKGKGGEIKGYHCWAEFYDEDAGWVPVDISEAWKDKTKTEYFFGTVNEDRIEFSQGRDIVLQPRANTESLNYFFYPYAEVDGKSFPNVRVLFRFEEKS